MSIQDAPDDGRGTVRRCDAGVPPFPTFIDERLLSAHGVDMRTLRQAMRPEDEVMRPEHLRAIKATRLSAARRLLLRMTTKEWRISKRIDEVDASGEGLLIYDLDVEGWKLSFVVWAAAPESEDDRLGRFYEHVYDFYGAIIDGHVDIARARQEAERMRHNVWQGRTDNSCLGWTVANRSNRSFNYAVEALVNGQKIEVARMAAGGGYVVRNAGWYGNGRYGSRSWLSLPAESPLSEPYFIDLFALYLWRTVSIDVVETIAERRNPAALKLSLDVRRFLGIGNSSGIGMVAALVRWPTWLSTYCSMREVTRAFIVTRPRTNRETLAAFERQLAVAADYYALQPPQVVEEAEQAAAISAHLRHLVTDISQDRDALLSMDFPWAEILRRAASLGSKEVEEQVFSLLTDIESGFTDAVAARMRSGMATSRAIDPSMTCGTLRDILQDRYGWALEIDFSQPGASEHFWYRSEENGENRRGERQVDPGLENETFVNVAGAAQELAAALTPASAHEPVGLFLLRHPGLAHMVARVQLAQRMPYTEIRANIIHRDFLPMDGIRLLLAQFGLEASSPYSTRWVRGVFFQGAPLSSELRQPLDAAWMFPIESAGS